MMHARILLQIGDEISARTEGRPRLFVRKSILDRDCSRPRRHVEIAQRKAGAAKARNADNTIDGGTMAILQKRKVSEGLIRGTCQYSHGKQLAR